MLDALVAAVWQGRQRKRIALVVLLGVSAIVECGKRTPVGYGPQGSDSDHQWKGPPHKLKKSDLTRSGSIGPCPENPQTRCQDRNCHQRKQGGRQVKMVHPAANVDPRMVTPRSRKGPI